VTASLTCKLERGCFKCGDRLNVMPFGIDAQVLRIWSYSDEAEVPEAFPGNHVGFSLTGVDLNLLADASILSDKEEGSHSFPVDMIVQNLINYLGNFDVLD
jgi:translation elongation factor EF-1alpha